jgi:hypothetical protein
VHILCWVPLLSPLAALTHVQLTAPCLMVLLIVLTSCGDARSAPARVVEA